MKRGTLIRGIGSFYTVVTEDGEEYTLRCKKKFRRMKMSPLVGDEVTFIPGEGEEDGWLEEILPRRSECIRPPAANVSLMLIVLCPVPEPDMLLVDRLLVRARKQNMRCALVVSKTDLDSTMEGRIRAEYAHADVDVYAVCSQTGEGLEELRQAMRCELCCLAGQSGVGKSTMLNALLGL
ncbi:MAG: GTPase RsgA [Clostridia bacterium]|nr:GTPase RsgA [Clostridia bacterium]